MNTRFLRNILAAIIIAASTPAVATDLPSFPFLIAKGQARMEVRPDKVTITVHVSAFDQQSRIAAETVQNQLRELLSVLASHSVPEDAITSFNLSKDVKRARKDYDDLEILGYYVSRRFEIELSEITGFAELVASIIDLNNVTSIDADFDITDRRMKELNLTNMAGADARRNATNMVIGMSRRVGDVYAITESSLHSSMASFALSRKAQAAFDVSITAPNFRDTIFEPSTITLYQTIHVMFELE